MAWLMTWVVASIVVFFILILPPIFPAPNSSTLSLAAFLTFCCPVLFSVVSANFVVNWFRFLILKKELS